jgi:hypothetical protein
MNKRNDGPPYPADGYPGKQDEAEASANRGDRGGGQEDSGVKYPEIFVQLTGTDGNAFAILGKVQRALRRAAVSDMEIERFIEEATSGDYDKVLATCMEWVEVG